MAEMVFTIGDICSFTGMSRTGFLCVLKRAKYPLVEIQSCRGKKLGVSFGSYGLKTSRKTAWSYFCSWKKVIPLNENEKFEILRNSITWDDKKKWNGFPVISLPFTYIQEDGVNSDTKSFIASNRYRVTCSLSDRSVRVEDLRIETSISLYEGENLSGLTNFKKFLGLLKKKHRENALREIRFRCFLIDWFFSLSAKFLDNATSRHDYDIASSDRLSLKYRGTHPFINSLLKIPISKINLKYLIGKFPTSEIKNPMDKEKKLRSYPENVWSIILASQYANEQIEIGKIKKYTLKDIAFMCDLSASSICLYQKKYPHIKKIFSKNLLPFQQQFH
jgi:hypothetical protein